ncbi:SpoIIE family protein phosphatase [Lutibacter sp. B2]|nr:SpoIIE family protein phosphatase [Lutibacter sp. B2]
MSYFIDVAFDSVHKYGEELCGDKVEIIRNDDCTIIVMADGLGSGVKANILATLTSKIAATMLSEGISIEETVDTIINTLPVCQLRNLAYATFTMIRIQYDGNIYVAEYDNPPYIMIRENRCLEIEKREIVLCGRKIKESNFKLEAGDVLTIVSDGAIHAGVGGVLNLGWQWENVAQYLVRVSAKKKCAKGISKELIDACMSLYAERPGDDTTVVSVKIKKPEQIDLLTGPPKDKGDDGYIVKEWMNGKGRKVVCGGTAANIVARELDREIKVSMDLIDPEVPPIAKIEGIDLVTEGVLTLSKALKIIKAYVDDFDESNIVYDLNAKDGASRLAKMLIEDCTRLNLWIGRAINPAHQNKDFPIDISRKLKIIDELVFVMENLGKNVQKKYT